MTNVLIGKGFSLLSNEEYSWEDAGKDFASGAAFQAGLSAFGKAIALSSKWAVSRGFVKLYWIGSEERVFWKTIHDVFYGGPGAQNVQWATFMNSLSPLAKALIGGGKGALGAADKELTAIYTLNPFERKLFQLAVGDEFSYFVPHWWKGAAGQFFARPAEQGFFRFWYGPAGGAAGNIALGRSILDRWRMGADSEPDDDDR